MVGRAVAKNKSTQVDSCRVNEMRKKSQIGFPGSLSNKDGNRLGIA